METTEQSGAGAENVERENPLRAEKRRKLEELQAKGLNPFPHNFERTATTNVLSEKFESMEAGETKEDEKFTLAGRLMTKRDMGKASFFTIQDQFGKFQGYIRVKEISEQAQDFFKLVDIGDFVGIKGFVFKTRKGELSLHCEDFEIICKTLEPLPEKYHGISDTELKYRQRYLDLIMSPESRDVFAARTKILREVRQFLDDRGFMEVETPILQPIYGGASASPFVTHHNALDMQLYMKISPELYLKRLIVGGFEKVYDMNKNFRNEGIDRSHNPEFTMLEWYEAYTDYNYQMKQFEDLVAHVCKEVTGDYKVEYQGKEVDFTTPWKRITMKDAIKEYGKLDVDSLSDDQLLAEVKKREEGFDKKLSRGELIAELFELTAEHHLWQPTFVLDHPVEISPLTKDHRSDEGLVERFEPFVAGMELGNAYTELNNPIQQRERLAEQEAKRVVDDEAQPMDEDFVKAIEVGMPPTGGVGLGIERLVMLLTDSHSIRDIILFPTMKLK